MSFRGLQKSVIRAPQQIRAKFNIGEHTKDGVYTDAERRFQELEEETKHLHDESKKYFDSINLMLTHQMDFSQAMTEIYKPISGRMSDPDSLVPAGNFDGIHACEEYEAVVKNLQETLRPELEMIETRVIRPANELMDVIKVIRKTIQKREHKKLDYDRHRASLKKLQDKKDRSAKDEKAMWKAEGDVEQATQDFNYFNDVLKEELPRLFRLEQDFIKPLFQSFYYMQLNIFYTLHQKMQDCDIGYFDLTLDAEEAFNNKRGDVQERAEALSIVRFRTSGQRRPPKYQRPAAINAGPSQKLLTPGPASATAAPSKSPVASPTTPRIAYPTSAPPPTRFGEKPTTFADKAPMQLAASATATSSSDAPPPPYSPPPMGSNLAAAIAAKKKAPPPVPKAKPNHLKAASPALPTCTALYDYSAQAEGDLSFRTGDVIEIITKSDNVNDWWTGRVGGKEGHFPGNYVQLGD